MMNKNSLNIYIGNHGKSAGIEDHITMIRRLMEKRNISVKVSSSLDPQSINLIIDEFTNYLENNRLIKFRKSNPNVKIVVLLTEFIGKKWGVESFNHFGNIFNAAIIRLFDIILRCVRDDIGRLEFKHCVQFIPYMPLIIFQFIVYIFMWPGIQLIKKKKVKLLTGFFLRYNRVIYFHLRYLGMKIRLQDTDAIITAHESIIDGLNNSKSIERYSNQYLGVIYPELDTQAVLDNIMNNKKLYMEITGSVTPYRKKWISRINQQLIGLGMHNFFSFCYAIPFSNVPVESNYKDRGAYSLHPPQSLNWPYSSPTRIFRALAVDHNMPVLTHRFNQNPIEDVCYHFKNRHSIIELCEMYTDRNSLKQFLAPKIEAYNAIAIARNDILVEKFLNLIE